MKVMILPGLAKGTVVVPPSKSMAHRLLICAGLSDGLSKVHNIDLSEDIKSTLDILRALGADIEVKDKVAIVHGIGNKKIRAKQKLPCRESGSTLRFFVPLVLTGGDSYEFVGAQRLFERPLNIYESICERQGLDFEKKDSSLRVAGQLKADVFRVKGNVSSQFITGLLFALPLLKEDSRLEILPPVESRAYIDMTLEALSSFGIQYKRDGDMFYIPGNQTYQATDVEVEGDYSNSAFLEAFNCLGGDVSVVGLKEDSLQGDRIYGSYFKMLKAGNPCLDISDCPDLGPVLMALAAALNGATFTGTKRLAIKESDRGRAMAEELNKFGVICSIFENEIIVHKGALCVPNTYVDSHNDHRIAMSMSLLLSMTGGELTGAEAVKKSYPGFFEDIKKLGISCDGGMTDEL